jgi:acyl carrier protein
MNRDAIRDRVKQIIANVTNIDPAEIGDRDSFVEDLDLDSLSLLEIGVDVDFEFKLSLPEERMRELRTVEDTVRLVEARLGELAEAVQEVA